ncbi:hypothetical protein [Nocardiopsis sp. NPDC006938]|uniref:hypothetical protein n=1 Tax=Nocardiopsis sp. NPDC006938 TaxID=3364337 RepID=UPI0036A4791F
MVPFTRRTSAPADPLHQPIPQTFMDSRHDAATRAAGGPPVPEDALTLAEVRESVRSPLACAIEAQRTLAEVRDRALYGTPEGRDMIAYATAWAIMSYPQAYPPPHPTAPPPPQPIRDHLDAHLAQRRGAYPAPAPVPPPI